MDSFGSRLRHERERRQIALKSIAESTKISVALLEGLERDDVSRWPSGIFRKSFIRSYAEAIGLKPEPIVREFVELYPDPLEVKSRRTATARPLQQVPDASSGLQKPSPSASSRQVLSRSSSPSPGADRCINTIGRLADWKIVRMLLDWRSIAE